MYTMAEDTRLPADIDAQPVVQAAAALQPELRDYREEIEREQRLPKALVEQLRAAGFYRMVIPRELGGLEVDPLTYLRAVELLAEGAGSVGWNLGNGGVGQLVTLGLPDDGVHEIYGKRADTIIAGTAVPGGGQAVPVEAATGSPAAGSSAPAVRRRAGCSAASRCSAMTASRAATRDGGSLYWRGVFARAEAEIVPGSWDVTGLRGTGSFDWTVEDVFLPERRTMPQIGIPAREPMVALARAHLSAAGPVLGRATPQRRDHRHRARRHQCADRAGRGQAAARPPRRVAVRQPAGAGRGRAGRRDPERRARLPQRDDHRAVEHASLPARRPRSSSAPAAGWPRSTPPTARARRWIWCTGTAAARRSSARAASPNAGATCTPSARPSPSRPSGTRSAAGSIWGWTRARACGSRRGIGTWKAAPYGFVPRAPIPTATLPPLQRLGRSRG